MILEDLRHSVFLIIGQNSASQVGIPTSNLLGLPRQAVVDDHLSFEMRHTNDSSLQPI